MAEEWVNLEDIPELNIPYPILAPEDLDHQEAQRILREEDKRIKNIGIDTFTMERPPRADLEGPPLSLEECKTRVPDHFVRNQLFRPKDPERQKNPKRKYPPSLANLQHVGLSRIILEKFIEKNKCLPNNGQIPIYFVQHLYCEEYLRKQVNWEDKGALGGVAKGRPADRKRARLAGTSVARTKPIVLTQEEQANIQTHAAEGVTLATQGTTALEVLLDVQMLREENARLKATIKRYEDLYGPLPAEERAPTPSGSFDVDAFIERTVNLDD